jgi:hypothetical protein
MLSRTPQCQRRHLSAPGGRARTRPGGTHRYSGRQEANVADIAAGPAVQHQAAVTMAECQRRAPAGARAMHWAHHSHHSPPRCPPSAAAISRAVTVPRSDDAARQIGRRAPCPRRLRLRSAPAASPSQGPPRATAAIVSDWTITGISPASNLLVDPRLADGNAAADGCDTVSVDIIVDRGCGRGGAHKHDGTGLFRPIPSAPRLGYRCWIDAYPRGQAMDAADYRQQAL